MSSSDVPPTGSTSAAASLIQEGAAEVLSVANDPASSKASSNPQAVFYNPAQVINRDLSILVVSLFSKMRREEELAKKKGGKKGRGEEDQGGQAVAGAAAGTAASDKPAESSGAGASTKEKDGEGEKTEVKRAEGLEILEALAASGLRSVRYAKEIPGVKQITCNDLDATAVEHMKRNLEHNKVIVESFYCIAADYTTVSVRAGRGPSSTRYWNGLPRPERQRHSFCTRQPNTDVPV